MSDTDTTPTRVMRAIKSSDSDRAQIKPVGWITLLVFLGSMFALFFALISMA